MLPGINSRLNFELFGLLKKKLKIRLKFPPVSIYDRTLRYSAYSGAKILVSCYNREERIDYWISKEDWEECGTKIIDKKVKPFLR